MKGGLEMRRTKIVCTIGPASDSAEGIAALLDAGMDVARLNLSHGSHAEHAARVERLREAERRAGRPLGILLDIRGPKIRTGPFPERTLLPAGATVRLSTGDTPSSAGEITIDDTSLVAALKVGSTVFLDDGLLELRVVEVGPRASAVAQVIVGGEVSGRKGVSVPGVRLDLPPLTEKDLADIAFGVRQGVDYIAASFVRRAEHVAAVRAAVRQAGGDQAIIAKIETDEAIQHLEEIVAEADGVMVARGDLGVEIPLEDVPLMQKTIIRCCRKAGKPVITATQMLESMLDHYRPTRAEVTDVAGAILDGTDAVMLSGETAVGRYPAATVRMMARIAARIETSQEYEAERRRRQEGAPARTVAEAISRATADVAAELGVAAILSSTQSGATARMVARHRPPTPILAVTPSLSVARRLSLVWGVHALLVDRPESIEQMLDRAVNAAREAGFIQSGDRVAITAGVKTAQPGSTNLLQVYTVP